MLRNVPSECLAPPECYAPRSRRETLGWRRQRSLRPGHGDVVGAPARNTERRGHPGGGVTGRCPGSELGVDSCGDRVVVDLDVVGGAPPRTMTYSPRGAPSVDVAERAPHDGLVQLRQLPGDGDRAIRPADLDEIGDRADDAMRRLVEHDRAPLGGDLGESPPALGAAARQEPLEHEPGRGQPADDQRSDQGSRARHGGHFVAGVEHGPHEQLARIADPGRPGIGHDGDVTAVAEHGQDLVDAAPLGVLVAHGEPLGRHPGGLQQPAGAPGVLAADQRRRRPAPRSAAATGRRGCRSAWRRARARAPSLRSPATQAASGR